MSIFKEHFTNRCEDTIKQMIIEDLSKIYILKHWTNTFIFALRTFNIEQKDNNTKYST